MYTVTTPAGSQEVTQFQFALVLFLNATSLNYEGGEVTLTFKGE